MADLQKFLAQAKDWVFTHKAGHGNTYHKQICSIVGISTSTAWCAAFVSACAKKSGNNGVIGMNSGAGGVCNTVIKKGGSWIKGPHVTHSKVKPQPGDLLLKVSTKYPIKYDKNGKRTTKLHGKHVAIVYKTDSTYVYTYEGNYGNEAADVKRKLNDTTIAGYARPKWSTVIGPLYTKKNDRHDMTIREIGYMDDKGKLTKTANNYQISIINYTSLLGDLFDMFVRSKYGGNIIDTSKLSGNEKIVVDYLLTQGFNAGAACGIAANIKIDSNYNPATHSGNDYGICKWTGTKAGQMRDSAGATSWATNLSGQLDFMMADLEINYESLVYKIVDAAVSATGAAKAASDFAKTYRSITNTSDRESAAKTLFSTIVIKSPKQAGTSNNGDPCKITDVSKKPQVVLSACWKRFEVGTADTSMINKWNNNKKPTNKGLCYLNNRYLVAYNNKYLSLAVGDYIDLVTTTGGTIPCIVAGSFNDMNTPIQVYRDMNNTIDLRDWGTVKIKQIKNYGKK